MTSNPHPENDRTAQRAAIERIIAHYPNIDEFERNRVFDYFRKEASASDRAAIADNPDIRAQYLRLSSDHDIDSLGKVDVVVGGVLVGAAVAGGLAAMFAT